MRIKIIKMLTRTDQINMNHPILVAQATALKMKYRRRARPIKRIPRTARYQPFRWPLKKTRWCEPLKRAKFSSLAPLRLIRCVMRWVARLIAEISVLSTPTGSSRYLTHIIDKEIQHRQIKRLPCKIWSEPELNFPLIWIECTVGSNPMSKSLMTDHTRSQICHFSQLISKRRINNVWVSATSRK